MGLIRFPHWPIIQQDGPLLVKNGVFSLGSHKKSMKILDISYPIGSMGLLYIFPYIWLMFMVNEGKYPPGNDHISHHWKRKTHLQSCVLTGYVSSQQGIPYNPSQGYGCELYAEPIVFGNVNKAPLQAAETVASPAEWCGALWEGSPLD